MNFPAWEKFHTLLENSRNAKTNSVACLCITLSFGWNLQFSPVRYFARGYPIRLPEVTFGISRARAISLEHKNTMFKYIKTLKCGQTKNIYFTKHDIYFTKLMLILQNINLELKSALRTKYWFYQTLLYWLIILMRNIHFNTLSFINCKPDNSQHWCEILISMNWAEVIGNLITSNNKQNNLKRQFCSTRLHSQIISFRIWN